MYSWSGHRFHVDAAPDADAAKRRLTREQAHEIQTGFALRECADECDLAAIRHGLERLRQRPRPTDVNDPIDACPAVNSAIVSVSTAVFSVILAALAGYGLSRFRFAGARLMETFILMTQMFPGVLLVIPYFILISRVGLFNTYPALIIAYTSFALPFSTWMLKGFFESVPRELDEAAVVDGCSRFKAFTSVVVPVSLPGIVATIIFSFILAWNEFLFALVLTASDSMYPVTVGIASFIGQWRIAYETMMAASVVATVPTIVLYMCLEKHLVQGLTAGAVKA